MVDPGDCSVAVQSDSFPGAALRGCDPRTDVTPAAANATLLGLLGTVRTAMTCS